MFLDESFRKSLQRNNRRGLGFWWVPLAAAGMQMMDKDGGASGGSPGSAGPTITTATRVETTVSPQISPIFIQQDEPTGSPINAGVSMTPGAIPQTGMIPGIDAATPSWLQLPEMPFEVNKPLLFGSLALLGAALVWKMMKARKKA